MKNDIALSNASVALRPGRVPDLEAREMSAFQWTGVTIIGLLFMLDGFDVTAIAFAAPALLVEWNLGKAELGYALSAGPLGMAFGSFLLSPLADSLGRRPVLLGAIGIMVAGTSWSAECSTIAPLAASRLLTGLGMGAMLGVVAPLAAGYANTRRRDLVVSLTSSCFAVGAILGGLLSTWLLISHGWRATFYAASALGAAGFILAWGWLLDPFESVVARPGRRGLARANLYLARCGHEPIVALPATPASDGVPFAALFAPGLLRNTLILAALYFAYLIPLYYMQAWLPTLALLSGMPPAQSALIGTVMSVGGVVAAVFIATTSNRIGLMRLQMVLLGGSTVMMIVFSLLPGRIGPLLAGSAITGFFLMGSMVGFWSVIVRTFPPHLRASGTGFVIGVGRLASTLPALLAGELFAAGLGRTGVSLVMTVPLVAALALLTALRLPTDAPKT